MSSAIQAPCCQDVMTGSKRDLAPQGRKDQESHCNAVLPGLTLLVLLCNLGLDLPMSEAG
jgi:hypothetical protein